MGVLTIQNPFSKPWGHDIGVKNGSHAHVGHRAPRPPRPESPTSSSAQYWLPPDTLDRLTSFTAATSNESYGYDLTGNRTSRTVGASNYLYTNSPTSNRLNSIADPTVKTYTYDAAGNMTADGAGTLFSYGARNRLQSVVVGKTTTTYALNALGQRVRKAGASTVHFAYDEQGMLVGQYDAVGLATAEVIHLGSTPIAVLRTDEVMVDNTTTKQVTIGGTWTAASADAGFQGTNYHQHAQATTSTDSFTWLPVIGTDATTYRVYARWTANANRATNATYTVVHAGGSSAITVNQQQGGGEWNLLGTFNLAPKSNHLIRLSGQGNGIVAADAVKIVPTNAATLFYIYADHIDTPRVITNTSNQLRWRWLANPFGTSAAEENPASLGAFAFNWRFPGQYLDTETNLHYNYFRDYDPGIGRDVQSDPIGLRGGLNTYAYVGGDPMGLKGTLPFSARLPSC